MKNIKRDIIIFVTVLLTVGLFVFLNCVYDLTDLDVLVKLSRIATPILVVGFGFLINRKLSEQKHYLEREFEIKQSWAQLFYQKAISYNDSLSELMLQSQWENIYPVPKRSDFQDDAGFDEEVLNRAKAFNDAIRMTLNKLKMLSHDIETYGSYSEKTSDVRNAIINSKTEYQLLLEALTALTTSSYDATGIARAQKKIVSELFKFHKTEILGKPHE